MSAERIGRPRADGMPSFAHLRRLTDDTGLLEHALGRIPRRSEGYTTDDNARALWLVTEWLSLGEGAMDASAAATLRKLAEIYMAFLLWTQYESGWWHNNVAYDRTREREEKSGNHDCQGRAVWAAADAWVRLEGALPDTAYVIVQRAMPTLGRIDSRRGQAFVMAACAHMVEADAAGTIRLPGSWRSEMTGYMEQYERLLNEQFRHFTRDGWRWFESALTYSNGLVPWAMLRAYRVTRREETLRNGLDSLGFLLEKMTTAEGWLRPIGNNGWGSPGGVSRWDQQPLEMFKLALALEEAARAVSGGRQTSHAGSAGNGGSVGHVRDAGHGGSADHSGSAGHGGNADHSGSVGHVGSAGHVGHAGARDSLQWRQLRDLALSWFHGNNDHRAPMCDPSDGSCCDGLMRTGPNINCGAESTISYLMTEALCRSSH